ncbi:UNVERIFIED_CONTAM: Regulator of telomere elongation helicase 1 [Sesamum radiatum]|uniref:Regulator of telomere elongation helicase 1 n=1 Tax=Sesamum radiatum TaxID=300843 RepID=A0AAW2WNZ8_SESRA
MEEFSRLGVGSIILTSGTLSPMDSFAEELKLEFPIRLENPHVISGNQIWAGVAPVGPSGYSFNSSYRSRGSVEYKLELGNAIVNFARIVPDGLLVFFPSYYLLDQCISCWKTMGQQGLSNSTTIWERICKHKLPVVEPRQSTLFRLAIEVSEGLDFADHAGRAVVITGLPFATMTDPKVRLKREYLDQHAQSHKIGNKCYSKFGDVVYTLTRFFRDGGHRGPPKLELAQNEDQVFVNGYKKASDIVDGVLNSDALLYSVDARFLIGIHLQTTAIHSTSFSDSASCTKQAKQGNISSHLTEIPPANRSSVTSDKIFQDSILKCSSYLTPTGKESWISGKKSTKDLDGESGDPLSPCILKKQRLLIAGPDPSKLKEQFNNHLNNLVKNESLQFCQNVSSQNHQEKGEVLVSDEIITQKETVAHNIQEHKDVVSQAAHCNNEEMKGSAFLIQVREKLTDTEYREFVGFMKALKSKAMKIGHVLQSIARLFSVPDRLSLLHGYQI